MPCSRFIALVTFGFVVLATGPLTAADYVDYQPYRLTTNFRGPSMSLDVVNGGEFNNMVHLADTGKYSGQSWHLSPTGDGYYRLSTDFRGRGMCLDVFNGGAFNNMVHMVTCADFSGQMWRVRQDGDTVRLTTQFRGDQMCLDIFNGGKFNNYAHLAPCANYSGQYWRIDPIKN